MEDLTQLIAGHAFLKGFEPEHRDLLVPGARRVRFAAGGVIGREGDETRHFYLVLRGEVGIEALIPGRGQVQFQTVGPGDALGWSWLFPPFQWHFTARAVQEVEALEWDTAGLRQLAEQHPRFGYELSRRLTQLLLRRLQATHTQLVGFYGQG
jgi:CRP/FNR family cyclic AMP-dependent transcriptional regulator